MSDIESFGANNQVPDYSVLIEAIYSAIKELDGSGSIEEINEQAIKILNLSDEVLSVPHTNSNTTEVKYRLAWSRTLLKKYGAIVNSARGIWSVTTAFYNIGSINGREVRIATREAYLSKRNDESEVMESDDSISEELEPWRKKLYEVLINMDPFAFERLAQRVLRESGFTEVKVTKKTGDGGIDGVGKLKINGIVSFNVAFQCKKYQTPVSAGEIRNFRGSLTTDIEKGIFLTTSSFSRPAEEEAANPGKQQIDLIDGEDLIDKLAEFSIGVREVKDYEIDEEFFAKL